MQLARTAFVAGIMVALALTIEIRMARAADSCSDQNSTCMSMCRQYGFGRNRADHPHPRSAETCRNHCIGWKTNCLQTGCWNGDLVQVCGLSKH